MNLKIVKNIGRLYSWGLKNDAPYLEDVEMIIDGDKIFYLGKEAEEQVEDREFEIIDARGKAVIPGFVDCHTHLVFSGSRWREFYARFQGQSYLEIQKKGGGIHYTVEQTRKASEEELLLNSLFFLEQAFRQGTTTMEVKTGYGLDTKTELKMLNVIKKLQEHQPVELVPTFLGPHLCPKNVNKDKYMEIVIKEMLPEFRERCERCDIFIEEGAFSVEDGRKYFQEATKLDYRLCAHMNQINDISGVELVKEFKIDSIDHLEKLSDEHAELLAEKKVVGVFLPIAEQYLNHPDAGQYQKLLSKNGICALSTDFNPGSAPVFGFSQLMFFSVMRYGLNFDNLLKSCTINPSIALNLDDIVGSLEPGKQADMIVLNTLEAEDIPYLNGTLLNRYIIKKGEVYPVFHHKASEF